jgi:hypothetical protein
MRVTRGEARIYPTVTFEAQPSEYIPMLQSDPALQAFEFAEIETEFRISSEFQFVSACDARSIKLVGAIEVNRPYQTALFARRWAVLVRACDRRLGWRRGLAACV